MLETNLKTQLQTYLQNLKHPVELVMATDDSPKSLELTALAKEIVDLSPLVSISRHQINPARTPTMTVTNPALGSQLSFAGLPMGHEFTSLVLALLHSGGHPMKLNDALIEQIRALPGQYHFETYISLSCQNCPDVVQALNIMAAINPNISHTMIDGALFPDEVSSRNVMSVPAIYLNGHAFATGRTSINEILNKLDSHSSQRQAKAMSQKEAFDVLIVGGGPAGASAAIYAARKGLRTGMVVDKFGGQVAETVDIENFISVPATAGPKLVAQLEAHVQDYDVDIMHHQIAQALHPTTATTDLFELTLVSGATLKSRSVLIATGAHWREMKVPGEQTYRGKGVAYCPHCDGPLFKGQRIAVIGGGNSGIEAAIDLAHIVEHVTVLEFDTQLRADDILQRKATSMANIHIITHAQTTEFIGDGTRVTGLNYTDRATNEQQYLPVAGIFVQIGLAPNAQWLKGTLDLTSRGEIVVNERNQTSIEGVFAAGDVTHSPFKQIIIAMGSGANAALGAFDYLIRQTETPSTNSALTETLSSHSTTKKDHTQAA